MNSTKLKITKREQLNENGEKVITQWLGDEQICTSCHGEQFPHIHTNNEQVTKSEAA